MNLEYGVSGFPPLSLILAEEETGCMKEVFALQIACLEAEKGKSVHYITPLPGEDIRHQIEVYHFTCSDRIRISGGIESRNEIIDLCGGELTIIDHFSLYFCDAGTSEIIDMLKALQKVSRGGTTVLLASDTGILPDASDRLIQAMADGVLRFFATVEAGKVKRFIDIPKMKGEIPPDKLIPFDITAEGITVDTRERHG